MPLRAPKICIFCKNFEAAHASTGPNKSTSTYLLPARFFHLWCTPRVLIKANDVKWSRLQMQSTMNQFACFNLFPSNLVRPAKSSSHKNQDAGSSIFVLRIPYQSELHSNEMFAILRCKTNEFHSALPHQFFDDATIKVVSWYFAECAPIPMKDNQPILRNVFKWLKTCSRLRIN